MKKSILFFLFIVLAGNLRSQIETVLKVRPILEVRQHYITFKGDVIKTNISSSSPFTEIGAGATYKNFDAFIGLGKGTIKAAQLNGFELLNFKSEISTIDLQFRYKPFLYSPISPYMQVGIGYSRFSSFTDLEDANGNVYYSWSDGKLKNLPESDFNEGAAQEIQRDFSYESPLAIDQSSIYFPLNFGIEYKVSKNLRFNTGWQFTLLQSDNMDRNTSTAKWDNLQSFNLGLSITFTKKPSTNKTNTAIQVPVNKQIFKDVDFESLLKSDEDLDGVNDLEDLCYQTPKGAVIDKFGCPSDEDGDGVIDFLDKELQSSKEYQIHPDGRAWSLEETQKHYNDSIAMFVRVLRKTSKKSRPYPVRKFIPEENYRKYDLLLEVHPDWIPKEIYHKEAIPNDIVVFDINKDGRISLVEIETLTHQFFDGKTQGVTEAIIQKAITYVFQHQ